MAMMRVGVMGEAGVTRYSHPHQRKPLVLKLDELSPPTQRQRPPWLWRQRRSLGGSLVGSLVGMKLRVKMRRNLNKPEGRGPGAWEIEREIEREIASEMELPHAHHRHC